MKHCSIILVVCCLMPISVSADLPPTFARSHVRFEYSYLVPPMPVVTNLEAPSSEVQALMAPVGTKCNQIPPANHKRWVVKMSVLGALAQEQTLTNAMSHAYSAADLIVAANLSGDVPRTELDRSEGVTIAGDAHHEGDAVAIRGVILALGCEADGDVHIDLAPSLHSKTCMVVEVPNPRDFGSAAASAEERDYLTSMWEPLRRRFSEIYSDSGETPTEPYEITVVGQLYFDTDHMMASDPGGGRGIHVGGRSCARNLWEVHSVLDMTEQNH